MKVNFQEKVYHTLSKASKKIPGCPHLSTLHRWRLRGIRGVNLKCVLIGGRWMVSDDALEEFFEQTTAAANGEQPKARTNCARAAAISKAEAELAKDGI
jgi:hypothetical protein